MKLYAKFADVCLPDYWGGHHLAHVSVPVDGATTKSELIASLHSEINQGAIAGSVAWEITESEEWHGAAHAAIDAIEFKSPGPDVVVFPDLELWQEGNDCSVYAYFVFTENE